MDGESHDPVLEGSVFCWIWTRGTGKALASCGSVMVCLNGQLLSNFGDASEADEGALLTGSPPSRRGVQPLRSLLHVAKGQAGSNPPE
ncbi:hypothetical protein IMZ48_41490 [Candidatus Bathyarchaeota archaeon]|nr:hypothetical protein [Candidatus Bathyarchaeota archaeon]